MTFTEALQKERRWYKRVIIINLYHKQMILKKKKWGQRETAKKLSLSLGAVSEAIKLATAILDDNSLESLTREEALLKIRQ